MTAEIRSTSEALASSGNRSTSINKWHFDALLSTVVDHVRWLSALAVMLGHARGAFLVDYSNVPVKSPSIAIFYFLTNLGTQAVVCFFVISGMLVGGKCIFEFRAGTFSPLGYAVDRFSRLYTVLIPALLLSVLLVWVSRTIIVSRGCIDDTRSLFWMVASNFLFLQNTIAAPICNNPPLWSLANEFWYYLLFPIILGIIYRRQRILSFFAAAPILLFLLAAAKFSRHDILLYFPIWVFGVAASQFRIRIPALVAASLFAAALVLSRMVHSVALFILLDYAIGLSLGVFLSAVRRNSSDGPEAGGTAIRLILRSRQTAKKMAAFSYSLYLVHVPVISLAQSYLLPGGLSSRMDPYSASGFLAFFGVSASTLLISFAMYILFERHTPIVRSFLRGLLLPREHVPFKETFESKAP